MQVRDLVGKSESEIKGILGDSSIHEVYKYGTGYIVKFCDCTLVEAKGHQSISSVSKPRQAQSWDRIQHYGEFGTSI